MQTIRSVKAQRASASITLKPADAARHKCEVMLHIAKDSGLRHWTLVSLFLFLQCGANQNILPISPARSDADEGR